MSSRRQFLRHSALTVSAAGLYPALAMAGNSSAAPSDMLQMGIAGYTFHRFTLEQSLAMMQRVGMTALSIKDFHLPLDSSPEKIAAVLAACKTAGVQVYAAGVIYMKTEAEVDRAFDYARKIGLNLIIGVPTYELLNYTEQKVKSENIRLAIHNHGPEDKLYPGPKDVYERIKTMDKRMGMCLDIGHALRAGADPVQAVKDYADRMMDLHIKDLARQAPEESSVEVGRGVIDFPGLVKALRQIKFSGHCSIEYEVETQDPLPGIAESVGYFRGVNRALS